MVCGAPTINAFAMERPRFCERHARIAWHDKHAMKTRSDRSLVHDLRELIAAVDRRTPRLEREGESAIARDAQDLRRLALKRIAELEQSPLTATVGTVDQETA